MNRIIARAAVAGLLGLGAVALVPASQIARAGEVALIGDGIVRDRSAYSVPETVERLTRDIKDKDIMLFDVIDQAELGRAAGVEVKPSVLVIFGNPPLGTQFLTAKQDSGLDWPVRLLVYEDGNGQVWTAYTDFDWIARRHGITNRAEQFAMASEVIGSIVSSVRQ